MVRLTVTQLCEQLTSSHVILSCKNLWIKGRLPLPDPVDGSTKFDGQQCVGPGFVVFLFDAVGEGFGLLALAFEQTNGVR